MFMKQPMIVVILFLTAMLFVLHCGEDDNGNDPQGGHPDASDTGSENVDAGVGATDTGSEVADTGTGIGITDAGAGATDTGTEDPVQGDMLVGRVAIPESFVGTPVIFSVLYFASETMAGMPDGFGATSADLSTVIPGGTLEFSATQANLTGSYHLAVTLYCQGGGNGMFPVAGVDWVGAAEGALTLGPGTGTIDVGQIELIPAK